MKRVKVIDDGPCMCLCDGPKMPEIQTVRITVIKVGILYNSIKDYV